MEKCEKFSFYWQRCSQSPSISLFPPQTEKSGTLSTKGWCTVVERKRNVNFGKSAKPAAKYFPNFPCKTGTLSFYKTFQFDLSHELTHGLFLFEDKFWQKCKTSGQVFPQLPVENWDTFYFSVCSFTWVDRWVVFPLRAHFGKSGKAPWSIFSLLLPLIICGLEKTHSFNLKWEKYDGTLSTKLSIVLYILQS